MKIKNNKNYIIAFLINCVALIFLVLFFRISEKTDDYVMKFILDGAAYGQPSFHLIYINSFLGYLLEFLESLIGCIAWFELSQFVVIFVSLYCLTVVLLNSIANRKAAYFIITAILIFFGYEAYIKLTFTKTAAIAIGVGLLISVIGLTKEKISRKHVLIGSVIMVFGCLYRQKLLLNALPIFFGIAICCLLKNGFKFDKSKLYITKRCVLFFVLFFLGNLVFDKASDAVFTHNQQWKEYREYNSYKVELQDYGWPNYNTNREAYESLGISYNDYVMWNNRDYSDPELFTTELMESVVEMKKETTNVSYTQEINNFLKKYPFSFLKTNVFYCVVILIFLYMCSATHNKKIVISYLMAAVMALYLYLYLGGRYGRQHVDVGMWFFVAMYLVYYILEGKIADYSLKESVVLLVAVTLLVFNNDYVYMSTSTYTGDENTIGKEKAKQILEYISEDDNSLYIMSNDENYGLMRAYGAFENIPRGMYRNIFCLSTYMYPSHRIALKNYGIENIYRSICNDNIFYITSEGSGNVDTINNYVREHYDANCYYTQVLAGDGVAVYKYDNEQISFNEEEFITGDDSIVFESEFFQDVVATNITGEIYKPGNNSFSSRIYIQVENVVTGDVNYYNTALKQNYTKEDNEAGRFSSFSVQFAELNSELVNQDDYDFWVILETEDGTLYREFIK